MVPSYPRHYKAHGRIGYFTMHFSGSDCHSPQVVPVILSGGTGSRLWPLSRTQQPKPFIPLPDGENLLGKTLKRVQALPHGGRLLMVTNRDYYFLSRDTIASALGADHEDRVEYLLEPKARNTAAAIAAAALWAQDQVGPEAVLLVLPSDHLIEDAAGFCAAVGKAARLAQQGYLVTFGVVPSRPETGYGYIAQGAALEGGFVVDRFLEKPNRETAEAYLAGGQYLWNAGIFCFTAKNLLQAMSEHAPAVHEATLAAWAQGQANGDTWWLGKAFSQSPDISIDYAVMESHDRVAVVPATFDWNDLGAWEAMGELLPADSEGNRGHGELLWEDSRQCVVYSPERLTALLGVEDLLVVDTPDALLIARRDRDQDVKRIVERLKGSSHPLADTHITVHRPWGTYTVLEEGEHFKIKRILVKPREKLSLQMHYHRSEHWIVVSGTAKVVVGKDERLVMTNESTFIAAGTAHRLENPGVIPLVLIEVQSGAYLGEDDIVRFEDIYGRVEASAPTP
jgi:mannose-1-phosphate guanylyltransferase/mannose-6-phosphate isomerase